MVLPLLFFNKLNFTLLYDITDVKTEIVKIVVK